jgi:hypothetical protein
MKVIPFFMSGVSWPFDSATTLTIVTTIATIVLAAVGALTLLEGRRQARIGFILLRLDRLYTPLNEIIRKSEGNFFDTWMVAAGGPAADAPIVYWDDKIAPLMAANSHFASAKLRGTYERVESNKSERTEHTAGEFILLASSEYVELLRRMGKQTGEKVGA